MSEHVDVKDLPDLIQTALKAVEYGRKSIEVRTSTSVILSNAGSGNGTQAFTVLVNFTTGQYEVIRGSWGGVNMFDRANPVDNDTNSYPLPPDGAAITGVRGGGHPVWAQLHIPAAMRARVITAGPPPELPKVEMDALYCHSAIKGGSYRREELRRRKVPASVIDGLVERGLLKRNKAGATTITTAGLNARGSYRG